MGKLKSFQITLANNPNRVYCAGDIVQGQLLINLDQPMQMRCIKLQFYGGSTVHWSERHSTGSGKNRRTVTRHYRNDETYFNQTVNVWGTGTGGGLFSSSPEHPSGQHVYPFQFQLPQNLPSSFEGAWGRVRYSIQGIIDKPWKFDHTTKAAFTVNSVYDLNMEGRARQPISNQKFKTLCCLCCTSGPITGKVWLNRTGYVPGEFITVNAEVDNKSNRDMSSSSLKLLMVTTFHARSKSRSSNKTIQEVKRGEIPAGETEVWSNQSIHIPPVPPSQLIHCNIIDIKFYLQLVIDPSGPAFDLEIPVEVLIGTVPLTDISGIYSDTHFSLPASGGLSIDPDLPAPVFTQPTAPEAATYGAPPPSYAECVFGNVNIREETDNEYTKGDLNYTPVYSYYSWDQQPPTAPRV